MKVFKITVSAPGYEPFIHVVIEDNIAAARNHERDVIVAFRELNASHEALFPKELATVEITRIDPREVQA